MAYNRTKLRASGSHMDRARVTVAPWSCCLRGCLENLRRRVDVTVYRGVSSCSRGVISILTVNDAALWQWMRLISQASSSSVTPNGLCHCTASKQFHSPRPVLTLPSIVSKLNATFSQPPPLAYTRHKAKRYQASSITYHIPPLELPCPHLQTETLANHVQ